MKILTDMAKRAGAFILDITGEAGVAKADPGINVSRPVLNGKDWEKWATDAGIPSPVAAADMHVTVVHSPIRVNMKPQSDPLSVSTDRACICLLGAKEDALAVVFESWILLDRFYDFYFAGALGSWSSYRPHLTLSYAAAEFQISDEALAAMPQTIILGGEVYAPLGALAADDEEDYGDGEDDDLIEIDIAATAKALESPDLSLLDEIDLRKAQKMRVIPLAAAKRLMPKAADGKKKPKKPKTPPAPKDEKMPIMSTTDGCMKTVEREMTMTVGPLPEAMRKSTASAALFKASDEEHLVIGWASVATVKGEPVVDLQGDTITVKAQREFLHSLLRNQRASKFEHIGDSVNEVVGGLIMDADLQKALGIDLGMEGLLVEIYVPDPQNWEMVKSGDWMYSIAGTVLVVEDA